MKNNQIDRISCGFYDNTPFDEDLLDILNRLSANPRIRGQKLKELAWEYIKLTMPEEVKKVSSPQNKAKAKTNSVKEKESEFKPKEDNENDIRRVVLR